MSGAGVVVFRRTGGPEEIDAIDEYSRRIAAGLRARGMDVRYEAGGLSWSLARPTPVAWVMLEYNPFRFGRWGFAPRLLGDAVRLRRLAGIPLAIMVHEAYVPMTDWRTALMGLWQRAQLNVLIRLADRVMASTEALARELGHGAIHVPVAANVTPVGISPEVARNALGLERQLVLALFGRAHPSRALDYAEAAIAAVAEAHGTDRLAVLNLGADTPPIRVPPGVELRSPGKQPADDLSVAMTACDLVLLPFTDGTSTRRTTLMAALAHERPVLGLRGPKTDSVLIRAHDAIVLTPLGDRHAFARAAVELAADRTRLRARGAAARRLYESEFAWPVIAARVSAELEAISGPNGR
jgi:glycosyltransferase involved in cell wall biosynthesis